jgi:hypothetical protein
LDGRVKIETQIHLNKYKPRSYQLPILDAIENKGYKRVIAIMPQNLYRVIMRFIPICVGMKHIKNMDVFVRIRNENR